MFVGLWVVHSVCDDHGECVAAELVLFNVETPVWLQKEIVSVLQKGGLEDGGYLYTFWRVSLGRGRGGGFLFLPSTFFAILKEGAVAVHHARPAALDSTAVAPVDVRDDVGVAGIPFLGCGEERI